jgi:hypothetical protein
MEQTITEQIKEEFYDLPFLPFDKPLNDVLLDNYIEPVAKWLIGDRANSVLAMEAKSVWETGLSVLFLAEVDTILSEKRSKKDLLTNRATAIAQWLLEKKQDDTVAISPTHKLNVSYWDKVTWDTSVVIRALLTIHSKYGNKLPTETKQNIIDASTASCKWLYYMFLNWDKQVKYPFGPADIGQILTTLLLLEETFPEIYIAVSKEFTQDDKTADIITHVADKLLKIKTEKTTEKERVVVKSDDDSTSIVTCWWDDYFSSAEVVEALALFYKYCKAAETDKSKRQILKRGIKSEVKEALVKTCNYFEEHQVDGMWGNHIDTIKVIYAYVRVRDLIPKNDMPNSEPLITPEIHTIFKALRWICDEKQIFVDNKEHPNSSKSFMHTMYLTVFYAHTLLEVYKYWDPVKCTIGKIYDDVVWAAPVRSTPERAQRLALELKNADLIEKIEKCEDTLSGRKRIIMMIICFAFALGIVLFVGINAKIINFSINFQQQGSSTDLVTLTITLLLISVSAVFGINKLFRKD